MDFQSGKVVFDVVIPPDSSFKQVCNIADKMNRKSEEGSTVFKLEINPGKYVVEIVRSIRNIRKRNPDTIFVVLQNDFINQSDKLRKALQIAGAEIHVRDKKESEGKKEFLSQDFLLLTKHNLEIGSYVEAIIRVNYKCNENCLFCWIRENETEISPEQIKEVIRELISKGIRDFVFTGGEPTLLKELPQLISYAKKQGARKVMVQTNGILLADKTRVDDLIESGLDSVFISLHSDNKEIAEKITGLSGSFDKTFQALENFLQTKIEIVVGYVIVRENVERIENFADWMIELYWKYKRNLEINFAIAQPMGKYLDIYHEHTATITDLRKYLSKAISKFHNSPVSLTCFSMASGPPLCAVENISEVSQNLAPVNQDEITKDFLKTKDCEKCKLSNCCWGLRKEYAKYFGTDEIKPITE